MSEPDVARDYHERGVRAAYSVLIELGQVLGSYRSKFVIVGGTVPSLLMPGARPSYVGSLDIDLTLAPEALTKGGYAEFIKSLEEACKPLLGDESVAMAYREIAEKFRGEDDFGPQTVRMFLDDSDALAGMTPEQVQVDAFRQVQARLKAMRLIE